MVIRKSISDATSFVDGKIRWAAPGLILLVVTCLFGASGCQRFPGSQAMRQYQMDSDRLLAEFRAEKKRREEVEVRNAQLEQRLAETEKLIARGLGGAAGRSTASNSGRVRNDSELMIGDARGDSNPSSSLSDAKSSRSTSRGTAKINRGGLPDALPSTSGLLTSGNRTDPLSLGSGPRDLKGDPQGESQWRPANRGK